MKPMATENGADRRLFRRLLRYLAPAVVAVVFVVWALVPFVMGLDDLALACTGRAPATLHSRWWSCKVLEKMRAIPADAESSDGRPLVAALLARADGEKPDDEVFRVVSRLVERGLAMDRLDRRSGMNALHDAILGGRPFVVAFLLVRGANPEVAVAPAAGPPMAGEKPLQLVSRLLERDDQAKGKAQTIADLLREAIAAKQKEQASVTRIR
jgi:hypothetical protein